MHPNFEHADHLSGEVIGAAVEVHRRFGPGLLESVYEKCLMRELELRSLSAVKQQHVRIACYGSGKINHAQRLEWKLPNERR